MRNRSAIRRLFNADALTWWGLWMLAGGVLVYAVLSSGCASRSEFTPATSKATRTVDEKGPRTFWRTTVQPPKEGCK